MKEIVVISGKGGTGKTTLVACFAALASRKVLADADVDAADLFILLEPEAQRREEFRSGSKAWINADLCVRCGECLEICRYRAINEDFKVDRLDCEGCGVCVRLCPEGAIEMCQVLSGEWFISETRYGPFVHARLGAGEENSGKLVALVRHQARLIAEDRGLEWIIVDGPPGIGCPVISSITGATIVLIVTEPTLSGIHDMKRVAELAAHFRIPTGVCINKWDLNVEMSNRIAAYCEEEGIHLAGRIPYSRAFSEALSKRKIFVEYDPGGEISREIKGIWERITSVTCASSEAEAFERTLAQRAQANR
jgi:MinD superfamily P-loop ATPase